MSIESIMREWTCAAAGLVPAGIRIDAHTHLGLDIDGRSVSPDQLRNQLRDAAIDAAVVTALAHDNGYDEANREVLEWAAQSQGQFLGLWRIDPRHEDPAANARTGLELGAVGIKLHPRAEKFAMDEPGIRAAVAEVAGAGGMVLIHAGRGMPKLGEHALALANDFPGANIVLAHAAVSDLSWIVEASEGVDNLVFDTSWWSPVDIATLLGVVPPGRVLFGSDPPYGTVSMGVIITARAARAAGYDDQQMLALFGGNLVRRLGDLAPEPLRAAATACADADLVNPPQRSPEAERSWAMRRAASYLQGATTAAIYEGNPLESLELALSALDVPKSADEHPSAEALSHVIRFAHGAWSTTAEAQTPLLHLLIAALTHASTSNLPIPAAADPVR